MANEREMDERDLRILAEADDGVSPARLAKVYGVSILYVQMLLEESKDAE